MSLWYAPDGRLRVGWRFFLGVMVVIFANGVAIEVALAIGGRSDRLYELINRPLAMVLLLVGFSFLLITADEVEGRPLAAMGLPRDRFWWRDILLGLLIGVGLIALGVALMVALHASLHFDLHLTARTVRLGAAEVVILAAGAMSEELMFRGYPFQRLIDAIGPVLAIVVLAFLFGVMHLGNPHSSYVALLNTIAVGVLLAIAYLKTRALWLPWGIHFGWNAALGMGFGLPVSGLTDFSVIVRGAARGPSWLTGADYGLEGSFIATLVIAFGILLVSFWPLRSVADFRIRALASQNPSPEADPSQPTRIQI